MTKHEISKLFDDRKIRTVWDDKEEKWYFSIVDVVGVLTDSTDPKQYIKRMKSRDESLKANWGTICTLVPLVSEDGQGIQGFQGIEEIKPARQHDQRRTHLKIQCEHP